MDPKWRFGFWTFHVGFSWHEVGLVRPAQRWVVSNHYLYIYLLAFWACQVEDSIEQLNATNQMSSGPITLPKGSQRIEMMNWKQFQARDLLDVKRILAISCLDSVLHKDPIRTQLPVNLAQILTGSSRLKGLL